MSDGSSWIEIVLLAMLAAFIGLRLVSVLGKRTGHERPIGDSFRPGVDVVPPAARGVDRPARVPVALPAGTDAALAPALEQLAAADASFSPDRFLAGASAAYRQILEAFWAGDVRAMDGLVSDEILENFSEAIREREGQRLPHRLERIEQTVITGATMLSQMAEVTVSFTVSIVAGDEEAVQTTDVWTFSRHVASRDPNWLLIATEDAPGLDEAAA